MVRGKFRVFALAMALSSLVAGAAIAQPLAGRSALGIHAGFWGQADANVSVGVAGVETGAGGVAGGLGYLKWLEEAWALELSTQALSDGDVTVESAGRVVTSSADFVAILIGARRYLPEATFATRLRPYLAAAAGPCIGTAEKVSVDQEVLIDSSVQLALAGYAGGGFDFLLSRRLMLEMATGYVVTTAYDPPVGGREDASGPTFSLGLSWLWGGNPAGP